MQHKSINSPYLGLKSIFLILQKGADFLEETQQIYMVKISACQNTSRNLWCLTGLPSPTKTPLAPRLGYFSPHSENTLESWTFLFYFHTWKRPYFIPELRKFKLMFTNWIFRHDRCSGEPYNFTRAEIVRIRIMKIWCVKTIFYSERVRFKRFLRCMYVCTPVCNQVSRLSQWIFNRFHRDCGKILL